MDFFSNSIEHLFAELERIDLLIQIEVTNFRKIHLEDEQFRGLYISEQEIDKLLQQPLGQPWWYRPSLPDDLNNERANYLRQLINNRKQKTLQQGITLRLDLLQKIFQLSASEIDIILICLAIELDLRYERLFAYLQDDITKKKPSVDLVLNLLQLSGTAKIKALESFYPDAPLVTNNLITFIVEPSYPEQPLLAKPLKLNNRIAQYILDSNVIDESIRSNVCVSSLQPEKYPNEYFLNEDLMSRLSHIFLNGWASSAAIINLIGANPTGKQCLANTLCQNNGLNLLAVEIGQLLSEKNSSTEDKLQTIIREAVLQSAAVFWSGFDILLDQENKHSLNIFLQQLSQSTGLTFLDSDTSWQPPNPLSNIQYLQIKLPKPTYTDRIKLWSLSLGSDLVDQTGIDISTLASKFKFTGDQILQAAATAKHLASWENPKHAKLTLKQLYEACRVHSNQKLSTLARKIVPKYQWHDIILPADRTEQLREICNHVKYRDQVYSDWGFDRKLAMGKGLCVLFVGPSGTGKTMAADIIAGELGLDLYKIDLSTVVSKYIGETEKNLSKVFSEAETSNAILFFDEADALFGKRSEVKDSHDRYANIETGYLLQRMEEYEGVVILASNFRKNMDEAFVRRLHFTVEFPFPNEQDRRRIWENVWPDAAPLDPGLNFDYLAGRFQMTGGNIRNIALSAAFLAADDNGIVGMQHLLRATQREYQKMGKVVSDTDFGANLKEVISAAEIKLI